MRPDIKPGARLPDYELPDQTGRKRKLSELQGDDPMILVLSRGHFCPKDQRQHRNLVELDSHHDPMIPHTFVLAPGLEVFRVYLGYWYWGRPSNEELRLDLREVTRKIRPDWDISDPALREAWERGDKDRFWPYGKSLRQALEGSE
jgi:hypothetical protein